MVSPPSRRAEGKHKFISSSRCVQYVPGDIKWLNKVNDERIACRERCCESVDYGLLLWLVGVEELIPDDQNSAVVLVEVLLVAAVVHPVIGRTVEHSVEYSKLARCQSQTCAAVD